jgi:hypothetical protein
VTPLDVVNRWYQGTAAELAAAEAFGPAKGAGCRSWACATPVVAKTAAPAITHVDGLNT